MLLFRSILRARAPPVPDPRKEPCGRGSAHRACLCALSSLSSPVATCVHGSLDVHNSRAGRRVFVQCIYVFTARVLTKINRGSAYFSAREGTTTWVRSAREGLAARFRLWTLPVPLRACRCA